ncbi:uncharacterized protein LOC111086803 [Limulus polyphemus]|uniref:Uncharacterized protein LOC111086803 n=1 Tax=Limulus polyphemus TaxID=6850 RepID=A0ABM1ST96_LIMPO|nr:uncharacterized protein LOC111086803 [Limulus polyphemus]
MYTIGKQISKNEAETLVRTVDAGVIRAMQKSFAFVCPRASMEGSLASLGIRNYHFGEEQFYKMFYSFAVPNGSPMKEAFGQIITRLNEMGIIMKLYKDVLAERQRKQKFLRKTNVTIDLETVETEGERGPRPLHLQELLSAFTVFAIGQTMAMLVFFSELGYYGCDMNTYFRC